MNQPNEHFGKLFLAFCVLLLATSSWYFIFISMGAVGSGMGWYTKGSQDTQGEDTQGEDTQGEDGGRRKGQLLSEKQSGSENRTVMLITGHILESENEKFMNRLTSNLEAVRRARQQIDFSEVWKSRSLFASPPYVCKGTQLIQPFEDSEDIHPPIPNAWLVQHRLEYGRPDLLQADLKGDGFTVLENYQTNTHPTDPSVHAPPYIKLRLKKPIHIPIRIQFKGSPDDGRTFALNIKDNALEWTQFLALGESLQVGDVRYILKDHSHKKHTRNDGLEVDVSELVLENKNNGRDIVLIIDQAMDVPTTHALFQILRTDLEFKVKEGEVFSIPGRQDYQYRLLDVRESEALIETVASGERHQISKLE